MKIFFDFVAKFNAFFSIPRVAFFILSRIPPNRVREFYGREFLSPVQQFALDGYSDVLHRDLVNEDFGCVVVLGGYLGDSSAWYLENFDCKVHVIEPILNFRKTLENRFINSKKIQVYPFAASDMNGEMEIFIQGEKTGIFVKSGEIQKVPCVDIHSFLSEIPDRIFLLEINIEGGEYVVLSRLIETGKIRNIRTLLVQFHRYQLDQELTRAQIRLALGKSHKEVFNYDWIWERWDLAEEDK